MHCTDGAFRYLLEIPGKKLERAKGFEPSTPTLARLCSTPELRPRSGRRRPDNTEGSAICNPCGRTDGRFALMVRQAHHEERVISPLPQPLGGTHLNWSQFLVRKLRKMLGFDSKTNPANPIEERGRGRDNGVSCCPRTLSCARVRAPVVQLI